MKRRSFFEAVSGLALGDVAPVASQIVHEWIYPRDGVAAGVQIYERWHLPAKELAADRGTVERLCWAERPFLDMLERA